MRIERKPIILVVDDKEENREMAQQLFESLGHKTIVTATYTTAIRKIHDAKETMAAFIDIHLKRDSAGTGLDLLRYIRDNAYHRVVPYAWTGDTSLLTETEALEAGAINVFHKGIDPYDRMLTYARVQAEHLENQEWEKDDLTKLPSHREFKKRVVAEMQVACKRGYPEVFSMIFGDVNDFKNINDAHGHFIGDEVLKAFAAILLRNVRLTDQVYHVCRKSGGADEVLMFLPGADAHGAIKHIDKLLMEISETAVTNAEGWLKIPFSASFGHAQLTLEELQREEDFERSLQELTGRADKSMYEAKGLRP